MALERLLKKEQKNGADPHWIKHLGDNLTEKNEGKMIEIQPVDKNGKIEHVELVQPKNGLEDYTPDFPVVPEAEEERMREGLKKTIKRIKAENPLDGLKAWIDEQVNNGVNEDRVRELIKESISKQAPKRIEVKQGDKVTKIEGLVHYQFELVLKALSAGVCLGLTGSTATSKTTMAIQAANALGKGYVIQPVNEGTTKADLLGYMSASGQYVPSLLHKSMAEGLLHIFEEIDGGSPASLLALNNAIDNRELTFPNGETVKAHENFGVICTMNSRGTGPDRKFVGRNRLDAATLDRFVILEIERDLSLEAALIGVSEAAKDCRVKAGGFPEAKDWLDTVRTARAGYESSRPDKIVSTRAVRDGWKLIQAGIGLDWTVKMTITK